MRNILGPMGVSTALKMAEPYYPHLLMVRDFADTDTVRAAYAWCEERFGESGIILPTPPKKGATLLHTKRLWCSFAGIHRFRNVDAAFEFKMRWG